MEPARTRREARSHQITGLARWNAKDSSDLHSRADANALQNAQPRGNTTGALRNQSGGAVAFPSEWRPLLRSDRLLGLPAADRQSLGCSPAIEGPSPRYPPKHARFSGRMSGSRRETHLATKLGELVADGARTRGKCAKTMHRVHAAEACSFCAESRAGRSFPATCGKRVPAEGEGERPRGHACVGNRRTYS